MNLLDKISSELPMRNSIVDQIDDMIQKYWGFISLPSNFLAKQSPFSPSNITAGYHLQTRNDQLLSFISSIQVDGELITIKDEELINNLMKRFGQDYLNIVRLFIEFINASGIICIQRMDDESKDNHNRIQIPSQTNCQCKRCKYHRFEIKSLLKDINQEVPFQEYEEEKSSGRLIAGEAYINFTLGLVNKAYYWLKEQRRRTHDHSNSNTEFLAGYNLMELIPFADFFIQGKQKDSYDIEVASVDLYKLIQEKVEDGSLKELMHGMMERKWFHRARIKIEGYLDKIRDIRELYDRKGRTMGPDYIELLLEEFVLLDLFYENNFLFDKGYRNDFQGLLLKVWEAIFISLSTSEKYEERIKRIHWFFIKRAIQHIHGSDLRKLFRKYKNTSLPLEPKAVEELIQNASNFFNSNHDITHVFGKQIVPFEEFISLQKSNFLFAQRVQRFGENLLLFLSDRNLSEAHEDELRSLFTSILNYYEFNSKTSREELKLLCTFSANHIEFWSEEQIGRFIDFIVAHHLAGKQSFNIICKSLVSNRKDYRIQDESFLKKLFQRLESGDSRSLKLGDILSFWPTFPEQLQAKFLKKIKSSITIDEPESQPFDLYEQAVLNEILPYDFDERVFSQYLAHVVNNFDDYNRNVILSEDGYDFKFGVRGFNVVNRFLMLVNQFNIPDSKIEEVLSASNIHPAISLVLNPVNFDYSLFDPLWVFLLSDPQLLPKSKITEEFKNRMISYLEKSFNPKVAEIYFNLLSSPDSSE